MREVTALRYWNSNGFAVAIVAVVDYQAVIKTVEDVPVERHVLRDWAVYIGGTDQVEHEADAIAWVVENGDKLSRADAHYFAPKLPIGRYRE